MSEYGCPLPKISFAAESEFLSPRGSLASRDSAHELTGQDGGIVSRIKKMKELMESLRTTLTIERQQLAKERMAAKSMLTYKPSPITPPDLADLQSFHSLTPSNGSYYYTGYSKCANGNVNSEKTLQIAQRHHSYPVVVLCNAESNSLRERLQTVEKMCQNEFNKLEYSINRLRISQQYLTDCINTSNKENDKSQSYDNALPRKSKKHVLHRKPTSYKARKKKLQPNFDIGSIHPTLSQYCSNYCNIYNNAVGKMQYVRKDNGLAAYKEYSPLSQGSSDSVSYSDDFTESTDVE